MSAWDLIPAVEIASFAATRTRNTALSNALTAIQKEAIAQMRTKDDKKCS